MLPDPSPAPTAALRALPGARGPSARRRGETAPGAVVARPSRSGLEASPAP